MKKILLILITIFVFSCQSLYDTTMMTNGEYYKIETPYKTYYTAGEIRNISVDRTVYFIEKETLNQISVSGEYTIIKLNK